MHMENKGGKDLSQLSERSKRYRERDQQGPLKKKSQYYRIEVTCEGVKRS